MSKGKAKGCYIAAGVNFIAFRFILCPIAGKNFPLEYTSFVKSALLKVFNWS
jgi:hypothetical protein